MKNRDIRSFSDLAIRRRRKSMRNAALGGEKQRKLRRATEKVVEEQQSNEQAALRWSKWTAMKQATDSVTRDSRCNCCSSIWHKGENRTFTFQLKLTEFNFTSKHQSFTISHIFEKHQRPPLPSFAEQRSNNQPGEDMPRAGASDRLGIVEGGDVDPPIQSDEAVFVDSTTTNEPPTDDLCEGKMPRIA
ncbi:hypothetical protein HID58_084745 [Brassica napus]|uniref:Uncharacterized protein n=1 Tax=Brassica napus TaxID=3708 RepID=A0ABQ7XM50_BRANA|nr:hypothetical protein HID58_084745 [Brassica napus]